MATPLLGHLDPQFLEIMNETQDMLRQTFQTSNRLTFPVSGTGTAGMETCVVNLIEPGDRMVVCVNGVFGQRMTDVAQRAGAAVTTIERPWGEVFDLQTDPRRAAKGRGPRCSASCTPRPPPAPGSRWTSWAQLCHEFDTLLLLDTVTSLGGVPVEIDAWGVDAVYSGTQKCLSCPPGLSPVSFSPRAVEVINRRKTKVQSWYLDMTMVQRYWGEERFYHHTAPDYHDLRPARGPAAGSRGGPGGPLGAAPAQSPGAQGRTGGPGDLRTRPRKGISCRCSTPCAFRRQSMT